MDELEKRLGTLERLIEEGAPRPIGPATIFEIKRVVALYYKIHMSDITGKKRQRRFLVPRHIAMYLARQAGGSYPEIGDEFDKDHVTVMHAVRSVEDDIARDRAFAAAVREIESLLPPLTPKAEEAP